MLENPRLGAALVVIGVLANNYIYLHDLIFATDQGAIILGPKSAVAIIVALALTAYGLVALLRSSGSPAAE